MSDAPDCQPYKIESFPAQPPPDESFISLSYAVSWIAFRRSIDGPALAMLLGIGKPGDIAGAAHVDEAILSAVRRLTDLGRGGAIEIWGRFFRDVLDDGIEIFTAQIPSVRLADFRWFDTLDDSLHRGLGLAWGKDRQPCYPWRDDRHYRFVTVSRADLMREFPIGIVEPTHADAIDVEPQAGLAPFTDEERREWMKAQPQQSADAAHKVYQTHPQYDGTKQAAFRFEWKNERKTRNGRPRKNS